MDWIAAPIALAGLALTYVGIRWGYPAIRRRDIGAQLKSIHEQLDAEVTVRHSMQETHRIEIEQIKAQHEHDITHVNAQLAQCREDHAETRGRLDVMSGTFADELAKKILEAVRAG